MKIVADQEGIEAVTKLCDVALKVGGLANMEAVNAVLSNTTKLKESEKVDDDKSE
ncbi:MAG: hypothetical protein GY861_24495 [bacterium]|nr:hypothetical protein [bacterium]